MLPVSQQIAARATAVTLSPDEVARYSRHLLLPGVGAEGQRKLKAARVLVVGAGGLGAPVSLYLAAAGIGTVGLVEFDTVDVSNLQRQILYGTADAGRPKIDAARERLAALNPHVEVVPHATRLAADNVLEVFAPYDVIVDGTDNFPTRYLAQDAAVLLGKPYVYGSIHRFDGQASVFYAPHGPCYRCLFPTPPPPGSVPSCAEGGVLGVLPGTIGSLQALETLKLVLGIGTSLLGRLHVWDAAAAEATTLRLARDPDCPACGERPTIRAPADTVQSCAVAVDAAPVPTVEPAALARALTSDRAPRLVDVRSPEEAALCRIQGSALVPLPTLAARLSELPRDRPLVVYCKSGRRSAEAVRLLAAAGFDATSLAGGILAWIDAVDPSLARY